MGKCLLQTGSPASEQPMPFRWDALADTQLHNPVSEKCERQEGAKVSRNKVCREMRMIILQTEGGWLEQHHQVQRSKRENTYNDNCKERKKERRERERKKAESLV